MMDATDDTNEPTALERISSGVRGLDVVFGGGFVRGAVYLVMGRPGTGKTTLGNQLCFAHVAAGGRAAYVTLLAESHATMLKNLQTMSFYDQDIIHRGLSYVGAYRALRERKLRGLLDMIRQVIAQERASFLVIDGISPARMFAESEPALKEFVVELQTLTGMTNCTTILLANMTAEDANGPEHTMVDGLVELGLQRYERGTIRTVEVLKFRGSAHILGKNEMSITGDGVRVHPRAEEVLSAASRPARASDVRVRTGVTELDPLLGGGLLAGTTSMVLGFAGSGKTTFAAHFLAAGAEDGESTLLFGFYESPERFLQGAQSVGIDLRKHLLDEKFGHVWQPPYEFTLDQLRERLFHEIDRRDVRRLVIDSLDAFRQAAVDPGRTIRFVTALVNELRVRNITTVITDETLKPSGPEMEMRVEGISALVENLILLEYVTQGSSLRRLLFVVKQRASHHALSAREFFLTMRGMEVSTDPSSAEELLRPSDGVGIRPSRRKPLPEGT